MPNQPATPSNTQLVAIAMQELMATNPELKGQVYELATLSLKTAKWALENADMATRVRVAQQFLPALVKEAAASDDEHRMRELQAQIDEMRATFATNFGIARDDAPEATEDTPPAPPTPILRTVS